MDPRATACNTDCGKIIETKKSNGIIIPYPGQKSKNHKKPSRNREGFDGKSRISILNIRHDRHMAGSLDRHCQSSLMLCTVACDAAGKDLASFRDILAQLGCILVIDLVILLTAEYADLFSPAAASSLHRRIRSLASVRKCHDIFLLSNAL